MAWRVKHNKPNNDPDCLDVSWDDTIGTIPGVYLDGVDLGSVSQESELSKTVAEYMKEHGAIFKQNGEAKQKESISSSAGQFSFN